MGCRFLFPASETGRCAGSSDGLCPLADRVTADSSTQWAAWQGIRSESKCVYRVQIPAHPAVSQANAPSVGQRCPSYLPARRPTGCLRPPKAVPHKAMGRRGNRPCRRKLPPERERCTSTEAPVVLSGVLRGRQAWRAGALCRLELAWHPLSDSLPTFCANRK